METKERNLEEEKSTANEELLHKKELLSDEELLEVAGGWYIGCECSVCYTLEDMREQTRCLKSCSNKGGRPTPPGRLE